MEHLYVQLLTFLPDTLLHGFSVRTYTYNVKMANTRLRLNFSLSTRDERTAFVTNYLNEEMF